MRSSTSRLRRAIASAVVHHGREHNQPGQASARHEYIKESLPRYSSKRTLKCLQGESNELTVQVCCLSIDWHPNWTSSRDDCQCRRINKQRIDQTMIHQLEGIHRLWTYCLLKNRTRNQSKTQSWPRSAWASTKCSFWTSILPRQVSVGFSNQKRIHDCMTNLQHFFGSFSI